MAEEELSNYKVILNGQKVCILGNDGKEICEPISEEALSGKIDIAEYLDKVKKELISKSIIDKEPEVISDKIQKESIVSDVTIKSFIDEPIKSDMV